MTTSAGAQQLVEMPHQLVDRHCRGIGSRGLYSALLLSAALLHHLFRRAELTISLHLLVDCLASPGVAGGQILVTVAQIHVHEKAKLFPMTLAVALSLVGSLPCLTYLQRTPPFQAGKIWNCIWKRVYLDAYLILAGKFFRDFVL